MAVTDEAINQIKGMILSGKLSPGDRLPREADLADRLGLSRNSLREAVRALALINVLDVRQGDGTYVTSLHPSLLFDVLSFVVDLHDETTALQFFEVRRVLEPAATALASQRMTDDDVGELRDMIAALPGDPTAEQLVAHDLKFHRRIALGSGNQVLCSLIESLSGPTIRAETCRGLTRPAAVEELRRHHEAICAAIANRQAEVARSWATVHITRIEEWHRIALD
ncbi:FadR/GntR family transcriptional regulator [Rhizohabitans arisaemae]|uniref:FadR/GntR family transcriptional regulator n=1 Tax=Rhizohabitans arisaemae TaxID=2720610 RepID=UPI0024B0B03C|nr:FadR/GntR family transcriptional regulator [Rhizohabitans arisaemae]